MRVNLQQERPAVPVAVAITKHSIHEQGWVFGITSVCFDRNNVDVIVSVQHAPVCLCELKDVRLASGGSPHRASRR